MSAVVELPDPVLRPMREHDLTRVVAVEQRSYNYPWSMGVFSDCLRAGYCCWVIEAPDSDQLGGYGIMTVAAGESHILNVCINPDFRRRSFGHLLMLRLTELAKAHKAEHCFLEVRPSNTVALRLYQRLGFRRIGLRRGYYPAVGGREDAVVLGLDLV